MGKLGMRQGYVQFPAFDRSKQNQIDPDRLYMHIYVQYDVRSAVDALQVACPVDESITSTLDFMMLYIWLLNTTDASDS